MLYRVAKTGYILRNAGWLVLEKAHNHYPHNRALSRMVRA